MILAIDTLIKQYLLSETKKYYHVCSFGHQIVPICGHLILVSAVIDLDIFL